MTNETLVTLPDVAKNSSIYLTEITGALKISRDVLASDEQIQHAWDSLPRVLRKIPKELITKGVAKMCVAVSCGLFDSGINYIWNETVSELRNKVKRFGLPFAGEISGKSDFDEGKLDEIQDSELLSLVLKLNLITEEAFFYLDQCRDIRNYFSAAHPPIGELDEHELINFTNRCVKYGLSNEVNPVGVSLPDFITGLKAGKFDEEQLKTWCQKIRDTHGAQREMLFSTLYGIYCDPNSNEETRVNALNIYISLVEVITPSIKSNLTRAHQEYVIKGNRQSTYASQKFFEKIGNLDLLGESERHAILLKACENLMDVHHAINNFYNELPFAERLFELTAGVSVPLVTKEKFVETVLVCGIGNGYGVARAAFPFYKKMVANFSPKEVDIALKMSTETESEVGRRLSYGSNYKENFKSLISLIDPSSVSPELKTTYDKWIKII